MPRQVISLTPFYLGVADNSFITEELLFASCRQHNVDLLREALSHLTSPEAIGEFINTSLDPLGNTALHTASLRGSLEVLDALLDQEGVEVDPRNRLEGDTPLHCAARLSIEEGAEGEAQEVVEMLLEAGADPRFAIFKTFLSCQEYEIRAS